MFNFADSFDYFLMTLGFLGALVMGAIIPGFAYAWGVVINSFSVEGSDMVEETKKGMLIFIYLGIVAFIA